MQTLSTVSTDLSYKMATQSIGNSVSIFDLIQTNETYPIRTVLWGDAGNLTNGGDQLLSTVLGVRNDSMVKIEKYNNWHIIINIFNHDQIFCCTTCSGGATTLSFIKIDSDASNPISKITFTKAT